MPFTRESVHLALVAKFAGLISGGTIKSIGRVWGGWDTEPPSEQPAVFIVASDETTTVEKGSPAVRTLNFDLVIYYNRGGFPEAIGATGINALLDAVDLTLGPDAVSGFQTLGGTVSHCWQEGTITRYEGTIGNDQCAVVYPVTVRLNQDNSTFPGQFIFDSGYLFGIPSQGNQTPVRIGTLRNTRLDGLMEINEASTTYEYPVFPMASKRRITGVSQLASISGRALNQVIFGQDLVAGAIKVVRESAQTIPATPYQITITPPSSGTFDTDLGIHNATTGAAYKLVTGTPATGEYTIASNVYTFAAVDATVGVTISYTYSVATGSKMTLVNAEQQNAPKYKIILNGLYKDKQMTVVLNVCVTTQLALPTVLENFMVIDFSFASFAEANTGGEVGTINMEVN